MTAVGQKRQDEPTHQLMPGRGKWPNPGCPGSGATCHLAAVPEGDTWRWGPGLGDVRSRSPLSAGDRHQGVEPHWVVVSLSGCWVLLDGMTPLGGTPFQFHSLVNKGQGSWLCCPRSHNIACQATPPRSSLFPPGAPQWQIPSFLPFRSLATRRRFSSLSGLPVQRPSYPIIQDS